MADGNSHRTLGVIAPDGEVVRTYTFNQNGFVSGSQEYLYGKDMIMVTDVLYPGTWYVRLSTDQTPAEKTSVTARLIAPFVWGVHLMRMNHLLRLRMMLHCLTRDMIAIELTNKRKRILKMVIS